MGGLCPKTALPIRPPWGETAPQYEGTVALDEYPFGKRLNLANGLIRPYKKGCVSAIWTYNLMPQKNLIPKFTRKTVGPQNKRLRQSLLSINSKTKKFPRSENFPFQARALCLLVPRGI